MIEFNELTDAKKEQYKDILFAMSNLDEEDSSVVILYEYKGKEKLLQYDGNLCRIWEYLNENAITYSEFTVDDDFDITMVALDDAILYENKDVSYFCSRKTNCFEDFAFIPTSDVDRQGYNGIATYSQYNEDKDIKVDIMYQHMQKPNNQVYKLHLKNPILIGINKKVSKNMNKYTEMYARYDFDAEKNFNAFRIATIKDYGLLNTFNKDLISLQKTSKIVRYYKVLNVNKKNEFTATYPFGNQYNLDEIYEYLNKLGFNTEVPDYLIDMNNQKNEEYLETVVLAANLKALNNAYIKQTGHSLKLIKEL